MASAAGSEDKIDIGRTIGRGFETIGRQFPVYLALSLLLAGAPAFIASTLLLGSLDDANPFGFFVSPVYWGNVFIAMLSGALLQATIIRSSILMLSGRPADVPGSALGALRLLLPLVGLSILTSIITGIGLILLIVPGIIAYIALIVSVPVLVEEGRSVTDSMERSAELTKGSRWRIFLLLLLFGFFYIVLAAVFGAVIVASGFENPLVQSAVEAVTSALIALLMAGMLASLYVELRTVKEGATTESLATIFE